MIGRGRVGGRVGVEGEMKEDEGFDRRAGVSASLSVFPKLNSSYPVKGRLY